MAGSDNQPLRQRLKSLKGKDKLTYLWEYYGWPTIGVVVILLFAISFIPRKGIEPLLEVVLTDTKPKTFFSQDNFTPYLTAAGYEIYEGCVAGMQYSLGEKGSAHYADEFMSLSVHLAAGQDVYLGSETPIADFAVQNILFDLRTALPEELLQQYEQQLIYAETDTGVSCPFAIRLTDHPWMEETGYYDTCVFALFNLGEHPEQAKAFATAFLKAE